MGLCFATNNPHKLAEVAKLLPANIRLLGLQEIGCFEDIPETADDLTGNAIQKAMFVWERFQINCFADDTGLEVHALNGAPGVFSARYAGPEKDNEANCAKLLQELSKHEDRKAQFRTVVCLILKGRQYLFEGVIKGKILLSARGNHGFGYDPLFQPEQSNQSFAEMSVHDKNQCSHRSRAINKLVDFLITD